MQHGLPRLASTLPYLAISGSHAVLPSTERSGWSEWTVITTRSTQEALEVALRIRDLGQGLENHLELFEQALNWWQAARDIVSDMANSDTATSKHEILQGYHINSISILSISTLTHSLQNQKLILTKTPGSMFLSSSTSESVMALFPSHRRRRHHHLVASSQQTQCPPAKATKLNEPRAEFSLRMNTSQNGAWKSSSGFWASWQAIKPELPV
jgi:hypothetical protein